MAKLREVILLLIEGSPCEFAVATRHMAVLTRKQLVESYRAVLRLKRG
jgi:hypothetical protein